VELLQETFIRNALFVVSSFYETRSERRFGAAEARR
jgi:hypothetical protein